MPSFAGLPYGIKVSFRIPGAEAPVKELCTLMWYCKKRPCLEAALEKTEPDHLKAGGWDVHCERPQKKG